MFEDVVLERIETPVERIWVVSIKGQPFWMSFDDFPLGLSLDAQHSSCNVVIEELYRALIDEATNK